MKQSVLLPILFSAVNTAASPIAQTTSPPQGYGGVLSGVGSSIEAGSNGITVGGGVGSATVGGDFLSTALSVTYSSISSAVASISLITLPFTVSKMGALSTLLVGQNPQTLTEATGTPVFNTISYCAPPEPSMLSDAVLAIGSATSAVGSMISKVDAILSSTSVPVPAQTPAVPTQTSLPKSLAGISDPQTIHTILYEYMQALDNEMDNCSYPKIDGHPLFRDATDKLSIPLRQYRPDLKARHMFDDENNLLGLIERDDDIPGWLWDLVGLCRDC